MRQEASYEPINQAPCDSYFSLSFLQAIKWIIWRSGTTYSYVRENITSPPHIATVLKPTLKIAARKEQMNLSMS